MSKESEKRYNKRHYIYRETLIDIGYTAFINLLLCEDEVESKMK